MRKFLISIGLILSLFLPLIARGVFSPLTINEIAWMGTTASYNNEWVELYNNSGNPVNLDGWTLQSADKIPKVSLSGTIKPKSFYLLERKNDNTLPKIKADLIYRGSLNNKGEHLTLYDNSGKIIDEVNCADGWFGGDNRTKQTMERISPLLSGNNPVNWQTSQKPGGTPKAANSQGGKEKSKNINYPTGIIFNEILPSPEGPDLKNEWIEIKNQNNFEVDLFGWQIRDKKGETNIYTFFPGSKISPLGFLVLRRPMTKITLNNSGDELELLDPNKKIIDSVIFGKAPFNQSYSRLSDQKQSWRWSAFLTPGRKNTLPTLAAPKNAIEKENELTQKTGTAKNSSLPSNLRFQDKTAAAGEKLPKTSDQFFVFLISFSLAFFSAVIILFLKKSLFSR